MMRGRFVVGIVGFLAIYLSGRVMGVGSPRHLDDQSPTAAKDDVVLADHDDSWDGDAQQEKFSYKYKNIGSKTIKVAVTVKAQHHGFYNSKPVPQPFHTETFDFTLAPGEEHEVAGTWKIDKPANEGDPEMEYADDDHPDLLGAVYVEGK